MAANPSTARNAFFKELKPRCVAINNLTVRANDKKVSSRELTSTSLDLLGLLESQINQDASALDDRLADYVFFPLANILRNQQEYPVQLTEVTIKCLGILIKNGWKSKIPKELSQQLFILLTFIIGGVPGKRRKDPIPEELKLEAFRALTSLVEAMGSSVSGTASLVEASAIPALGHTVTVVLDAVTDGETPDIQLGALRSLDVLFMAVKDHAALATFLPGTVSSLSKLLTPPAAWKISRRVLVKGIATLRTVLVCVLGDIKTMGISKKKEAATNNGIEADDQVLTPSWLKATAEQIKLALANVLKLRSHESENVEDALERFCISLLDECHHSLKTCTPILVETAMILSKEGSNKSALSLSLNTSLTDLAGIYPELTDTVKTTVYNWVTALPRIVQSSDEKVKRQAIRNLCKGQSYMSTLRIDSSTLGNSLVTSLRDSVTALVASEKQSNHLSELPLGEVELSRNGLVKAGVAPTFQPILMAQATQKPTRVELVDFIYKSGSLLHQPKLVEGMLECVRESTGNNQIATYWLAFEFVKSSLALTSDLDDLLDLSSIGGPPDEPEFALQELYSFSVSVLDSASELEEPDWRLPAVALEVTTYAASRMGSDFRPELIDVLYPIATFLGSVVPQLREHAIISLNSIAASCGYPSVADLVIDNVDYMLNSVSLRLDIFDISPASIQVLKMMVKLTGPKLMPFLDDVVASIFAALENYHGYPLLVENLFGVLAEIVNQGSRSDVLLLEDESRSKVDHRKRPPQMATLQVISEALDRRFERKRRRLEEEEEIRRGHPTRPWTSSETAPGKEEDDEDGTDGGQDVEKKSQPKTPTYTLLARITDLTQHYLTSPTPTLRKSLLDLLSIVCPALSPDEEAFLPLVNSVWPGLISRLHDPETFVVVSACTALSALCASAGDFLSTRVKTEWWDHLGKWCTKAKSNAAQTSRTMKQAGKNKGGVSGLVIPIRSSNGFKGDEPTQSQEVVPQYGLGKFTHAAQIWEAVQELLVAIVSFVQIDDDIFKQMLDLLADSLESRPEARKALEVVNPDAVWLLMYERGRVDLRPLPKGDEFNFLML